MPTFGQEVTFTWNVTAFAIGQILVVRTSFAEPVSVTTLITDTHTDLPTTVDGIFTDNPGSGTWRYSLLYSVSLDPDVPVEALQSVDAVSVTWPTENTTDSNWAFPRQKNPAGSEDGNWSTVEPTPPTTDGLWSSLRQTSLTEDSLWSLPRAVIFDSSPTSDGNWSGVRSVIVLPGNNPPVLRPFSDWIIEIGEAFTLDMDAYGSDPNADTLAYTVTSDNAFTSVVARSGNRYIFQGQSVGVSTITVVVSDGTTTATQTFTITVAAEVVGNGAPSIAELAVEFVEVGTRGDKSFVNQRGLSDPDGDHVIVLIEFVANPLFHAFVDGGDTIFIDGLQVGVGELTVIPVDEHGLRGSSVPLTIVVYETAVGNQPPVCTRGPRISAGLNPSNNQLSRDYDLNSYLSDPDGDRVFIRRVDYDRVHGSSDVSLTIDGSNVLHVSYTAEWSAGVVEITPTDEHGLSGDPCHLVLYIGYFDDDGNDRYPAVILPIPDITVCATEDYDYDITDYISNDATSYRFIPEFNSAGVIVQRYTDTATMTRVLAHITSTQVGIARINVQARDGYHGNSNIQSLVIVVEDCNPTTDSAWSPGPLRFATPNLTIDGPWAPLAELPFEATEDSNWSSLEFRTPDVDVLPPTIDLKANGQDALTVIAGTQVTISWIATNAASVTLDLLDDDVDPVTGHPLTGSFAGVFTTIGTHVYQGIAIGSGATASDTVAVTVTDSGLPTRDSTWSPVVPLSRVIGPTINSEWSVLIGQFAPEDHEVFIRSNDYFPCHDSGVYISWNIIGANRSDTLSVFEDGSRIALLVSDTHSGEWAGTRYIPSRYRPGGNTVTYRLSASRRNIVNMVDQAEVLRLTAVVAALDIRLGTELDVLDTRLIARSAARRAYSSAQSATSSASSRLSSAHSTYLAAVGASGSASSRLSSAQSISNSTASTLSSAAATRRSAQSTYNSDLSAYNSDLSSLNSCYATNPNNQAVACASEYSAAQSSFSTATSSYNSLQSAISAHNNASFANATAQLNTINAQSAYNSALSSEASALTARNRAQSSYNSAVSSEASALRARNSADAAYTTQLGIANDVRAERTAARLALARARTGTLITVITDIISESIDVEWVFCDPTTDSDWSQPIGLLTISSQWSEPVGLLTQDSEWSEPVGLLTQDSEWSEPVGLLTQDSEWSEPVGLLTQDSEWSEPVGLLTQDSEWSNIIGPIVCDSAWSPFIFLGNENGEWSELVGLITDDSAWSNIVGPIVCDSVWSPFTFLGNENSEWSELVGLLTQDSAWSNIVGPIICDSPWGPFATLLASDNSEWSTVSNVAYAVRSSVSLLVSDSEWSKVSSMAYEARPGAPGAILYHGEWSSVSNFAYYVRLTGTNIVYHGAWTPIAGPAYRVRPSNPTLIFYAAWSAVSNAAYRVRPGAPVQIVYHSAWSAVSNVARQEREVLSAIGGAEPFLHIYEARRGLVRTMRLVDHATPDLFGTAFEEAAVNVDRDDDRVFINPLILLSDLRDGQVSIDVYRTTDSTPVATSYRFYIATMEGVDPNIQRVYYDVTPSALFIGTMPYSIRVAATATAITFQRKLENGLNDGALISFSFGGVTVPTSVEFVVVAVSPQHDDARLSRIVYRQQRLNDWYYYHGVPEIYVSDPLEIIASEDASSYNGRDSANFQSPPHVGYASAVVRQHQSADSPWFEELLDRNHVITGQRVHIMLRDKDFNYGKDFSGILQSPPIQHRDNIYDWRLSIHDPTTLMVQSFANSALLVGPQDAVSTRTVGSLIQRVCQAYADRVANLNLDDVLDPAFDPDNFPVPLAWFWTDYESERDILQRLVNTQGPPTGFYVNNLGQLVFTGCEDRGDPIYLGGVDGIPISQVVTFSDHVVDVSNDARIPVSLHGWVLPDAAATPEEVYQEPDGLPEAVQVQLFETYSDNAIFDLARGGNIVFDDNGEYRYRVRTGNPVLPPDVGGDFRVVGSSDVTVIQLAANMLDIIATGTAGEDVPSFQVFGAELKHFRTMEHWTSPTVRDENATRFSLYLYHQREFSYAGYNSIAQRDAQILADWAVRYYRRGIKTITLQLFCSNDVQEALRLEPDRTPVRIAHNYGAGAPDQWIVRSRKHIYRDGHFWIDVTLDEDIMYSLGLDHSPLCALYEAPDPNDIPTEAKYTVTNAGALTFTGADGAALIIPQHGLLSLAPNLAATVLPIAQTTADPQLIARHPGSANALFALEPGKYRAAHFNLARLDALNEGICYQDGIHPVQISLWLVEPALPNDPYWAVVRFRFNADAYDGLIPGMFHFMRVRYAALGLHQDVVLSFVTPPTTMHMGEAHWITVAQEQPWLDDDDAGVALTYNQHVIILDWQAFETDITNSNNGSEDGGVYVNDAVIASDAMPSTNVKNAIGGQIVRRFGRA